MHKRYYLNSKQYYCVVYTKYSFLGNYFYQNCFTLPCDLTNMDLLVVVKYIITQISHKWIWKTSSKKRVLYKTINKFKNSNLTCKSTFDSFIIEFEQFVKQMLTNSLKSKLFKLFLWLSRNLILFFFSFLCNRRCNNL